MTTATLNTIEEGVMIKKNNTENYSTPFVFHVPKFSWEWIWNYQTVCHFLLCCRSQVSNDF